MEEVWRPVYGFVGFYEMSTMGCVKSVDRYVYNNQCGKYHVKEKILKTRKDRYGYSNVKLCKDGVHKRCLVHRLVAMTFPDLVDWTEDAKGRPFEELTVNHLNEVKTDNRVENLQWCSAEYNHNYGTCNERSGKSRRKPIAQKTIDGQLVRIWDSPSTAAKELQLNYKHIVACALNSKPTAYGFKWSYLPPSC